MLLLACTREDKPFTVPDEVLPPDKMQEVLVDIHVAEAAIERDRLQGDTASFQKAKQYYEEIYAYHIITEEEFNKSFSFYQNNPKLFGEIYAKVIETLSQLEGEASAIQPQDTAGVPGR